MKGLLLKDWYMLLKYGKGYLLICIVFFAVSIFGDGNMFFVTYPMILSGLIPVTLIAYDERSGWMSYSGVFPYSRKLIVSVKYVYALAIWAVMMLLMFTVQVISRYMGGAGAVSYIWLVGAAGLIPSAIMLPIVFKLGSEKGRIAYMAVIVLICAMLPIINIGAEHAAEIPQLTQVSALVLLPAALIIFAVSWLLSIRVFERREL